jgi:hypothetical protein
MIRADGRKLPPSVLVRKASAAISWPAVVAVVSLFVALTVGLALYLSIWQDEAYSMYTSSTDFVSALRKGLTFEAQAPLYFGVLELWRTINGSVFFARLLSIAFSCATLAYAWHFARRYIRGVAPEVVLAFVALNPFLIWAAVEIRPYPAAIALSTALLYYLFRGWVDDDDDGARLQARAAFVLVAILGAYTQYYLVNLVAAGAVAVLLLGRRDKIVSYLVASSIVAFALVPLLFIVPSQLRAYSGPVTVQLPGYVIVLALFQYLFPHDMIGGWAHRPKANAAYFTCILLVGALLWRQLSSVGKTARLLLAITIPLTVSFGLFIGVAHIPVNFPRQTAVLFAPTLFMAAALIGDVRPKRRPLILQTYAAVYVALALLSLWMNYRDLAKVGDWARVGEFLNTHVSAPDAVAVFDSEVQLPLRYYFTSHALTSIPRPLSLERFDEGLFVIHDEREVARSLDGVRKSHTRVWLVMNDLCTALPKYYGCTYLDTYVAKYFKTVDRSTFNRSSVTELTVK